MGADITKAVRKCPRVTYSDSFSFKFILEQLFLRHDLAVSVTEEGVEYDSQPVMDPCAVELQFIMRIRVPAVGLLRFLWQAVPCQWGGDCVRPG